MVDVPQPRIPEGLNPYECDLWLQLFEEWDPQLRLATQSMKITELSQRAKDAIMGLAMATGMTVRFSISKDGQHYLDASRPRQQKTAP